MIVSVKNLDTLRKKYRNKKIVFAGGVFDIFHPTHIKTFKNLRKYGDIVVIGIVSDKRVRERKGLGRPVLNQKERIEMVDAIQYVDYVIPMGNSNSKKPGRPTIEILENLKPDIFVTVDNNWGNYRKLLKDLSVKLVIVKRIAKTSSTLIIERILKFYK